MRTGTGDSKKVSSLCERMEVEGELRGVSRVSLYIEMFSVCASIPFLDTTTVMAVSY